MATQEITWTALPRGASKASTAAASKLRLSIYVSPRLRGFTETTLATFPDFGEAGGGWAATAASLAFDVIFHADGSRTPRPPARAAIVGVRPVGAHWDALFGPETPVKGYTFPGLATRPVLSFDARNIVSAVKAQYQSVAKQPALTFRPPTAARLVAAPSLTAPTLARLVDTAAVAQVSAAGADQDQVEAQALATPITITPVTPFTRPITITANPDFAAFQRFHAPLKVRPWMMQKPQLPDLEFHDAVAQLSSYPALMRVMGIVIDIEVPASVFGTSLTAKAGKVRVKPVWPAGHDHGQVTVAPDVSPWTRFRLDWTKPDPFLAQPRVEKPQISEGQMLLRASTPSADPASVVQLNVDIAAQLMKQTANDLMKPVITTPVVFGAEAGAVPKNVSAQAGGITVTPDAQPAVLPAMRTLAPSLYLNQAKARLQADFARQKQLYELQQAGLQGDNIVLFAEDVTHGWVVDVWDDQTKQWHSLCERIGKYEIGGTPVEIGGQAEHRDEGFIESAVTADPETTSTYGALKVHEAMFDWDGWSLAVARPGRAILPGLNPDGTTKIGDEVTDSHGTYKIGRYVHPDFPLLTTFKVAPGTLPRVRFGYQYRFRARAVDVAGNHIPLRKTDNDFTKLTVTRAVRHERLEPVPPPAVIPRTAMGLGESVTRIVLRSDIDTLPAAAAQRHIVPPRTSETMAEAHGGFDTVVGGKKVMDKNAYALIVGRETDLAPVGEIAAPVGYLPSPLPYLPDVIARGASFRGLPGNPTPLTSTVQAAAAAGAYYQASKIPDASNRSYTVSTTQVSFETGGAWHERKPFVLSVTGIEALDARVPKHATPKPPDWNASTRVLTVELAKAEQVSVAMSCYVNTTSDMPRMGVMSWAKSALTADPTTSALVTKLAGMGVNWMVTPAETLTLVHAVKHPLLAPNWSSYRSIKRNVNETFCAVTDKMPIHGKSTLRVDVTGEWKMPVDDLTKPKWELVTHAPSLAFSVEVQRADTTVLNATTSAALRAQRHEFGDTKRRTVTYKATAVSRFKDYFLATGQSEPEGGTGFSRAGTTFSRTVPSSARPPAPKVAYVMPSFEHTAPTASSKKRRGGLRVYLERPWFASGEGEELGVVFWNPAYVLGFPNTVSFGKVRNWTTEWGADPIWYGANLPSDYVTASTFPGARVTHGLPAVETAGVAGAPGVSSASYPVAYDESLGLWYADIRMEAGSAYFPFVKLALARYQPVSVAGQHLSPIALCDFIQTVPDRVLSVSYDAAHANVTLGLSGATYTSSGMKHYAAYLDKRIVQAEVQSRAAGGDEVEWTTMLDAAQHPRQYTLAKPTGLTGYAYPAGYVRATFPVPPKETGREYRVILREWERYMGRNAQDLDAKAAVNRLIYAETMPL